MITTLKLNYETTDAVPPQTDKNNTIKNIVKLLDKWNWCSAPIYLPQVNSWLNQGLTHQIWNGIQYKQQYWWTFKNYCQSFKNIHTTYSGMRREINLWLLKLKQTPAAPLITCVFKENRSPNHFHIILACKFHLYISLTQNL